LHFRNCKNLLRNLQVPTKCEQFPNVHYLLRYFSILCSTTQAKIGHMLFRQETYHVNSPARTVYFTIVENRTIWSNASNLEIKSRRFTVITHRTNEVSTINLRKVILANVCLNFTKWLKKFGEIEVELRYIKRRKPRNVLYTVSIRNLLTFYKNVNNSWPYYGTSSADFCS
jgi:hypothetical protein